MGLKHSNIQQLVGVEIDFRSFAYGAPLNQAALAGEIDILLTADQPAIALLAREGGFKIIGRMMYNRTCLYVPTSSDTKTLEQLRDATIAGPVGAAAERVATEALGRAGIEIGNIRFGNLDMGQQVSLIAAGAHNGRWGPFHALYGFDPFPAVFEISGKARMLHCGNVISLVLASPHLVENRPQDLKQFLLAFQLSWWLYANQPERMNQFFLQESGLQIPVEALELSASVEPNRLQRHLEAHQLVLNEPDFEIIDSAATFLLARKVISTPINARLPHYTKLTPLQDVLASGQASKLIDKIVVR